MVYVYLKVISKKYNKIWWVYKGKKMAANKMQKHFALKLKKELNEFKVSIIWTKSIVFWTNGVLS